MTKWLIIGISLWLGIVGVVAAVTLNMLQDKQTDFSLAPARGGWPGLTDPSVETALKNIPKMFPGVTRKQIKTITAGEKVIYKVLGADGKPIAWVGAGKHMGRWDNIDMLVALDPTVKNISKIHIVSQRERYWESKVVKAGYVESFVGKKTDPIVMVKKTVPVGQQVQAVTKATVTSKTICRIVNTVVGELKAAVAEIRQGTNQRRTSNSQQETPKSQVNGERQR
jgi:hypothetical protein